MKLVESINRARELAGMLKLSEAQVNALVEQNKSYVIISLGLISSVDLRDKEITAKIAVEVESAVEADELIEHAETVEDWVDAGVNLEHIAQNLNGGDYVPGSAYFRSATKAKAAPANSFRANAGDIMAA